MELNFNWFDPYTEKSALIQLLLAEEWPFHVQSHLVENDILGRFTAGTYDSPNSELYWITPVGGAPLGLLHIFDLDDVDDGSPSFDLRITATARGRGIGVHTVRWLDAYLFGRHPQLQRISATTRADNFAMRSAFTKCGYVKEGHFRQAWPTSDGKRLDSLEYSILRNDWVTGAVTPVDWANG